MIKNPTRNVYTAREFRLFNQCVGCYRALYMEEGTKCERCMALNLKHCEICDITLRYGVHLFYTYDIKDGYRNDETDLKPNTKIVREFTYRRPAFYPPATDTLCSGCVNWEKDMKFNCAICNRRIKNCKEDYKLNGNLCKKCLEKLND